MVMGIQTRLMRNKVIQLLPMDSKLIPPPPTYSNRMQQPYNKDIRLQHNRVMLLLDSKPTPLQDNRDTQTQPSARYNINHKLHRVTKTTQQGHNNTQHLLEVNKVTNQIPALDSNRAFPKVNSIRGILELHNSRLIPILSDHSSMLRILRL